MAKKKSNKNNEAPEDAKDEVKDEAAEVQGNSECNDAEECSEGEESAEEAPAEEEKEEVAAEAEEAAEEERLEIEYARPAGKLPVEKKPRIKPGWEFVRVDEIETEFEVMHQTTEDLMALTAGTGFKTRSQISKVCGS